MSPSWNRENQSLVFGSSCLVPFPPSELPLISCVLFSLPISRSLSSLSLSSSIFPLLPSSPLGYVPHSIFSHGSSSGSYTCLDIPLPYVLSSSTWLKWRLSVLLEAVEEARSFRSVSSHIYSSLPSRLSFCIVLSLFFPRLFLDLLL